MVSTQRQYVLGIVTIIMWIVSYIPYLTDMFKGKTKPHIFTWVIWWTVSFIMFLGQQSNGAWAGSRTTAVAWLLCTIVAVYSFFHKGIRIITRSDYILTWLAIVAIVIYLYTDNRRRSVMLLNIADILSFAPTIRKSWSNPHTETISMYAINALKFIIVIIATAQYSFITTSNNILRIILNTAFVIILYQRRKQISL
jgi:hypothetical protein